MHSSIKPRAPRYNLKSRRLVFCINRDESSSIVKLINISVTGVAIDTNEHLKANDVIRISVIDSSHPSFKNNPSNAILFTFSSEVVHTSISPSTPLHEEADKVYRVGMRAELVEFVHLLNEKNLLEIIH